MVSRDRWGRVRRVHYLPNGVPLVAGSPSHKPHILLTEDLSFTNPLILRRDGNRVYIHFPNQVITVEGGGTLNLTNILVEFVPLDSVIPDVKELLRLEGELFNPHIGDRLRKFLRLFLAYSGLKVEERVPESLKDSVVLLVSRMLGVPPEKVASERVRLMKRVERDIREVLSEMSPEEVLQAFSLLFP